MTADKPVDQDSTASASDKLPHTNEMLEERIFIQLGKLEALCNVRTLVDAGEKTVPQQSLMHYSQMVEQEVKYMRQLLDRYFS